MGTITIIIICIGALILGAALSWVVSEKLLGQKTRAILSEAEREAEVLKQKKLLEVKEKFLQLKGDLEQQVAQRNNKLKQIEGRLKTREQELTQRHNEVEKRNQEIDILKEKLALQSEGIELKKEEYDVKKAEYEEKKAELELLRQSEQKRLEALGGLSADEARERLIESLRAEAKDQAQGYINEIVEEAKMTANKEAKRIVVQSIQRLATETAIENSVTVFHIESDEIKGRIIGREGRNIRALEAATGIEIIVDDTPEAIVLSSFDPVRREVARLALHQLVQDGRIHPARIEEVVSKVRKQIEEEIIETGKGDHAEAILTLHRLAQKLRARRFEVGSIAFDRPEVRFELDEDGKPVSVYIKESKPAHQLIEEFMLLANRTVAERIAEPARKDISPALRLGRGGKPAFVYRIHEAPDEEKLRSLADYVRRFGYKLKIEGGSSVIAKSLNALLADIKGKPEEDMLTMLAIRSMAKARYTTTHIGHYGLGFDSYTHFTSPIRRYPDLMVHRLLTRYLIEGKPSADAAALEDQCDHASEMESVAANAERSSIKYKQVEYMIPRLGEAFTGVITGLADWGFYVELEENKCEGLVPARDLSDDYYVYDEANFRLVGRHTGRTFTLGQRVEVVVAQADLARRQLDFALDEPSMKRPEPRRALRRY